jgi:electron transport complex protein RnfE
MRLSIKQPSAAGMALRTAVILLIFVVAFTSLLAAAFLWTRPAIEAAAAEEKMKLIGEVLPRELYDNDVLKDSRQLAPSAVLGLDEASTAYLARKGGEVTALVFEAVAPDGYSGKIRLLLGVSADGTLLGVRVIQHKETPGLGDYIEPKKDRNKERPWIRQFDGLSLAAVADRDWRVRKDGGRFDSVAGATVTPRAVIKAVHKALQYVAENHRQLFASQSGRKHMISRETFRQITANGVWQQNTSLVQILGLCPLLAVTTNLVNGVMLSLATIIVMAVANVAVASLRNLIPHEIRIPVFILIVAALVTVVDLVFNAQFHELYLVLGIFIPLIVTNCIVLARIEAFANKNPPLQSLLDGVFMGVGMLWTLALLGGLRELIGGGTLFAGIDMVFPGLQPLQLLPADYPGFLLTLLPPGAFILLGCLIAWKNWVEARVAARQTGPGQHPAVPTVLADRV